MSEPIEAAFQAGELEGLHAVRATHRGDLIVQICFDGEDERWGYKIGSVAHKPDKLHDVRSISKSVVGLLYGIALERGLVPPVDAPLVDSFPIYPDLAVEPDRRKILIRHALSMTMGLEWDETISYADPKNSEVAMERAPDRWRFALEQPIVQEPGSSWTYSGGAAALIGRVITTAVGKDLDAFAKEALFDPLGITHFEWVSGKDGCCAAASGLRLTLLDLAKVGELIVAKGRHDGVQIIPEGWIEESFTPRTMMPEGLQYGYFWFLSHPAVLSRWVAGFGNGGQRLMIHPDEGIVYCVFAGRYNDWDAWQLPMKVLARFVYPAIRERMRAGIR